MFLVQLLSLKKSFEIRFFELNEAFEDISKLNFFFDSFLNY